MSTATAASADGAHARARESEKRAQEGGRLGDVGLPHMVALGEQLCGRMAMKLHRVFEENDEMLRQQRTDLHVSA